MSKVLDRVADTGGILHVLLVGVGYVVFVSPVMPASLDSPEAVAAHLAEHPPTASFWVGVWLEAAGVVALVLLAARVAGRIRVAAPAGWLPSAGVGLAVAACTVKLSSFAPALAALDVDLYDPGTVTALLAVNEAAFDLSWGLDGAAVLLLGLGALSVRALPGWLAAWAAAAGAAVLVGLAVPGLFDALQLVFLLWLLAASGWLIARGARCPVAADPVAVGG